MKFDGKTYWIIGASEGLGRAIAIELGKNRASLIVSARNQSRLDALLKILPKGSKAIALDVADKASVRNALEMTGGIDGVIFAAGAYWPMKSEEWDQDRVETMLEVNFLGAARCLGPIVKRFAKRDFGHIVVIGSLSGFRGLRGAVGYGASKAGLMHLTESIHADLHRTNVKVQLVNPGFVKTRLTDKNDFEMPFIMTAEQAAKEVVSAMRSQRFQSNFPRVFSWVFRGANFLPAWIYFKIMGAKK